MIPQFDSRWDKKDHKAARLRKEGKHLGWKWSRLRAQYISYFPFCTKCGKVGEEVHHVHPRSTHPHLIYNWNNLQTLCKDCHKKEHTDEEVSNS